MSVRPAWFLRNIAGFELDIALNNIVLSELLKEYSICDECIEVSWGASKIKNFFSLVCFCFRFKWRYEFVLIPSSINQLVVNVFRCFGYKVIFADDVKESAAVQSRISNNISMARRLLEVKNINQFINSNIVDEFDFVYNNRAQRNVDSTKRVAVFMGASLGCKAAPIEVVEPLCIELLRRGNSVYEITDGQHQIKISSSNFHPHPKCTLKDLVAFFSEMDYLVVGDTGLAHLADLFGVKVILLSGPTLTEKTKPLHSVVIKTANHVSCAPCYGTYLYDSCPNDVVCMKSIDPLEVVNLIDSPSRNTYSESVF